MFHGRNIEELLRKMKDENHKTAINLTINKTIIKNSWGSAD